ncbi:MAG: hypothetical protein J5766_03360 [Clostridia bacterium]|nr:hypothetical protein [Clostridia bacterium]
MKLKLLNKEKLEGLPKKLRQPKTLVIIGLVGILIIGLSSLIPKFGESKLKTGDNFDCDEYRKRMEDNVRSVVSGITGDKRATVVVTLKNGIRYSYADDTKSDSSQTDGEKAIQSSSRNESNHITVKTSSGEEKALVVTENMPEIRGVAIVCLGGDYEVVSEEIKRAVMAALDITERRIYITARN